MLDWYGSEVKRRDSGEKPLRTATELWLGGDWGAAVMKPRRQTVRLKAGDVRALRIIRGKRGFRLVIYDEDTAVPLIQAMLSAAEREAIREALGPDE